MFAKMVAKLIFERAVMLDIFKGRPVLWNKQNSLKYTDLEMVIVLWCIVILDPWQRLYCDMDISDSDNIMIVIIWHDSQYW